MTTKDILELDFRDEKSYGIMQKVLKKVGPLSKIEDDEISLEKLERMLYLFPKKYFVEVVWILVSNQNDYPLYTLTLMDTFKGVIFKNVYGITLYEVVSKAVVAIWASIKAKKILKR